MWVVVNGISEKRLAILGPPLSRAGSILCNYINQNVGVGDWPRGTAYFEVEV